MTRYECSVASRQRDEAMFATASPVRRWLMIEVRGPWGRDRLDDTDLGEHVSAEWRRRLEDARVRVLAVRREVSRAPNESVQMMYACSGHADDPRHGAWSRTVAGLEAVEEATGEVPIDLDADPPPAWAPVEGSIVLLCTHGRHDSCCATYGRPVMRELRSSPWADVVWESSHVGGDRFAANIVILPEGIYYGRVEPQRAAALLDAHADGQIVLDLYRGRSAFGFGEQAAEYFVRRKLGLDGIDDVRAVLIDRQRHEFDVAVAAADGQPARTIGVRMRRVMHPSPSPLTCTGGAGARYPVYHLVDLHDVADEGGEG